MNKPNRLNAFPSTSMHWDQGMALRDYFAACALTSLAEKGVSDGSTAKEIATASYMLADAMLDQREAQNEFQEELELALIALDRIAAGETIDAKAAADNLRDVLKGTK